MNIPIAASLLFAAAWPQFGHDSQHTGAVAVNGEPMLAVLASVVMDPFVSQEQGTGQDLLVHYATPIVDDDDIFVVVKSGTFTPGNWSTQSWGVEALRWQGGRLHQRWMTMSNWKPVPYTGGGVGPAFEPVFQPVLANGYIYMPGAGISLVRLNRDTGAVVDFPDALPTVLVNAYITSPLVTDASGNVYFNVIMLNGANPWTTDIVAAYIEKLAPDNRPTRAQYSAIVSGAPAASAGCRGSFSQDELPWPPSQTAVPPDIACGSQRPGINVAPAIANDGTIYTVSRAHFNSRYSYLVALNPDMTPKWTQSLRDRFNDGCNVTLPQNGAPGGCRGGAFTGFDPADNTMGAGRVIDDSSSSPLIAPDGSVFYGAYTRYNFSQGHLMHFTSTGTYLGAYPFGWDITPGIYAHANNYSIITKENRYPAGTYCDDPTFCPVVHGGAYFITALDPSLHVEWSLRAPKGFEWCINGPAIDANGVSYVNSEDGWLYSINPDGTLRQSIQLTAATGQAYTPVVVDDQGRIYAEKAGTLFVVGGGQRVRAVRK